MIQKYERGGVWAAVPVPVPLHVVMRGAILNALAYTDGARTLAATLLEISPRVLRDKIRTLGIPAD